MEENSFLDKSILVGFCFPIDTHHEKCRAHLDETDRVLYATENVDGIYDRRKAEFVRRHRRAVKAHVRELTASSLSGKIGEEEVDHIRLNLLSAESDAYRYLKEYYTKYLESGSTLTLHEMKKELSEIVRGYESVISGRKEEWDDMVNGWACERQHPRLDEALSELKENEEEDFEITVEAHDLAAATRGTTQLVTANPADFALNRYGRKILEETDIWKIDIVAVTKSAS